MILKSLQIYFSKSTHIARDKMGNITSKFKRTHEQLKHNQTSKKTKKMHFLTMCYIAIKILHKIEILEIEMLESERVVFSPQWER